jgi:hypothetical protein
MFEVIEEVNLPLITLEVSKTLALKDFSPISLGVKLPQYKGAIETLESLFPKRKKYLTVDVFEQVFTFGNTKTCRNTGWHVDGVNNHYLMWSIGHSRTLFLNESLDWRGMPVDLRDRNQMLEARAWPEACGIEIPESTAVIYSSDDVHKGRTAEVGTKRILLRLCYSDYVKPKNKVL